MSRLPAPDRDTLDADQRAVYDEIASGPHGRVVGPYPAWLQCPELARRARALSAYIRFEANVPRRLAELAILVTGAHWRAEFEYHAHARLAREAGVDEAVIAAIAAGQRPAFAHDDEALVYDMATELLQTRRVGEATYRRAVEAFGLPQVVELVATVGYYCMVSLTLNAFEMPLPEGAPRPFPD